MTSAEEKFEAVIDEAIFIGIMKLGLHPDVIREVMLRRLGEAKPNELPTT